MINKVKECLKRLSIEPTAPIQRVVNAVCHYDTEEERQIVLREVREVMAVEAARFEVEECECLFED